MAVEEIKVSELPRAASLTGLIALGVDQNNDSVAVPLTWLKEASDDLSALKKNAAEATVDANKAAAAANKAKEDADTKMAQISQEASAAIKAATDAAGNAQEAADNVQDGKTTQFEIGTVESGAAPSASLTDNGVDATGNPKKKLNLVMQKGDNAKSPTVQTGTITAGDPASEVTFTFAEVGMTEDGRPIWRVDGAIPRGQQGPPGAGSGNVSVDGTGLVIGKKYLFVPSSDDSTAGTFVEYVAPEIPEQVQPDWNATEGKGAILHKPGDATADASGLMSADQFQKLEKLSPDEYVKKDGSTPFTGYIDMKATETFVRFFDPISSIERGSFGGDKDKVFLFNGVRGKSLNYSNDGKLLFEDKETFAVDADNELTLAGKKLSELGGGQKGLDIAGLFLAALANPTEQFPVSQDIFNAVVEAYENYVQFAYAEIEGQPKQSFILSISYNTANEEFFYNVSVFLPLAMGGIIGYCDYNVMTFRIYEDRKICEFSLTNIRFEVDGDGTKALMDDGTYKDCIASATKLQTARDINGVPFDGTKNISIGQLVPIMVEGGTDLNDFITPGMYFNDSDAVAATIKNVPIAHSFSLLIEKHAGYKQTFTVYGNSFIQVFVRNYSNSAWGQWFKIPLGTFVDIPNLNTIPVSYDIVTCSLNTNTSIAVENAGLTKYNGYSISVYVYTASVRTITIPTTGNYVSMCGSSYTTKAGKWVEFNLTCVDGKWHIAKLEQE